MRFKKCLISFQKAQSSIEYFIIFTLIIILALSSFNTFLPRVREALQGENGYFKKAAQRIIR